MFLPGHRVECVDTKDAPSLTQGAIYTVKESVESAEGFVYLEEVEGGYFARRFRLEPEQQQGDEGAMRVSDSIKDEITTLVRARAWLIWVVTRDEQRVEKHIADALRKMGFSRSRTYLWDVSAGVYQIGGKGSGSYADPGEMLNFINNCVNGGTDERSAFFLRDLPPWLVPPIGNTLQRQLKNLGEPISKLKSERHQVVFVITSDGQVPASLASCAQVINWPEPDAEEMKTILKSTIGRYQEKVDQSLLDIFTPEVQDASIEAARGLSASEAEACFMYSLAKEKKLDPDLIAREKKRTIVRDGLLEWFDPLPGGLDAVGGLDELKKWLLARGVAFSKEARAYGLPAPKGALLVGVPGCGKSLTAKAIATAWGVPLLRMDLGALKSKYVGESEANLRRALSIIEATGRCVVWLDELEKGLAGAVNGAADGGVSADALGAILNWMQERKGESFVIATSNNIFGLPPELLRKGRFDDIWFVDLPSQEERVSILKTALHNRPFKGVNTNKVAKAAAGFTGAEIAALVPDALYRAFAEKARPITTEDLMLAVDSVVPLSKTAAEPIKKLRAWAEGRARPASSPVFLAAE